jgi:hypothetical protein
MPTYRGVTQVSGWSVSFDGMRPEACARAVARLLLSRPPLELQRALASSPGGGARVEVAIALGQRHVLHVTRRWVAPANSPDRPSFGWRIELRRWGVPGEGLQGLLSRQELMTVGTSDSRADVLRSVRQALASRLLDLRWAGVNAIGLPRDVAVRVSFLVAAPRTLLGPGASRPSTPPPAGAAPRPMPGVRNASALAQGVKDLPPWLLKLAAQASNAQQQSDEASRVEAEVEVLVFSAHRGEG